MLIMNNKECGMKAENFLMSRLNALGIPHVFVDDWYDFDILGQKVELKSCRISIKAESRRNKRKGIVNDYRIGRFDFTSEENRQKQSLENIWICFIVRHQEQFMILGLCRARECEQRRYITIHNTRELRLISLEEWIRKHNQREGN